MGDLALAVLKIGIISLVGGIIALIGDNVGRMLGKRRFRLFGLRPRYSSMILTVVLGTFVSFMTILILALLSSDVRVYLFSMEKLKRSLQELREERQKLISEINFLNSIKSSGQLIYPMGSPIVVTSVKNVSDVPELKVKIREAVRRRVTMISKLLGKKLPKEYIEDPVELSQEDLNALKSVLRRTRKRYVVIAYAESNTFLGEKVKVRLKFAEDKLIFSKGQVLLTIEIDPSKPPRYIISQLISAIPLIQEAAIKRGKIPLPDKGGVGGSIDPVDLLSAVEEIKRYANEDKVLVSFIAPEDIYMTDEFTVKLKVIPMKKKGDISPQ